MECNKCNAIFPQEPIVTPECEQVSCCNIVSEDCDKGYKISEMPDIQYVYMDDLIPLVHSNTNVATSVSKFLQQIKANNIEIYVDKDTLVINTAKSTLYTNHIITQNNTQNTTKPEDVTYNYISKISLNGTIYKISDLYNQELISQIEDLKSRVSELEKK